MSNIKKNNRMPKILRTAGALLSLGVGTFAMSSNAEAASDPDDNILIKQIEKDYFQKYGSHVKGGMSTVRKVMETIPDEEKQQYIDAEEKYQEAQKVFKNTHGSKKDRMRALDKVKLAMSDMLLQKKDITDMIPMGIHSLKEGGSIEDGLNDKLEEVRQRKAHIDSINITPGVISSGFDMNPDDLVDNLDQGLDDIQKSKESKNDGAGTVQPQKNKKPGTGTSQGQDYMDLDDF